MQSGKVNSRKDPELRSQIKFRCSLNNTILDVLRNRGWQELGPEDENFDFFWCSIEWMRDNFDHKYLADHVRLCHFRNHFELTRKNLMVRNLKRAKKRIEKETGCRNATVFDFVPTTFELPMEYHMFLEEFRKNPGSIWIMKPVAKSQGKGIFLFRRLKDIEAWKRGRISNCVTKNEGNVCVDVRELPEHYVVSRYIDNPYLIGGRKFDLRVYVLVTSFQPLKAWVYRDGFARLSNVGFSMESIDDQYVHLTNVAIQKTAPDYDAMRGCKWSICRLRRYMLAMHGFEKVTKLFQEIDMIFIVSLLSVEKVMISDKHCFELYGYDILVDNCLKPWLLEINASPSLTASSNEDYALKAKLLGDTLNVVDMEGRLNGDERRVGDFDCVWDGGPVAPICNASKRFLSELQGGSNPAVPTGLQFSHQGRGSQQAGFGSTSNSRSQRNNGKKNLADWFPLGPINSYLGCLPLRKHFDDDVCTQKGSN